MAKSEIVELARRAVKGDAGAFERLCLKKQRDMMFVAMSILGNADDAEDAAQESIIRMCKSIRKLRDVSAINVWIEKIVRNESFKIYNSKTKTREDIELDDENISLELMDDDRDFLPEAYVDDAALAEKLYQQVMRLPAARRDAIIMYYYEGLSYKEISDVTGISIKSVSSSITRARITLKQMLTEDINQKDGNSKKAVLGVAPTATVIGQSLKLHAANSLPDEKMEVFSQKWMAEIQDIPFSAKPKAHAWKAVVSVVATATILLGIVFAFNLIDPPEKEIEPISPTGAGREIVFTGNDCECGHINPQRVEVVGLYTGDSEPTWQIVNEGGSEVIFTGDTTAVNDEIKKIKNTVKDGRYTLMCTIVDRNQSEITLDRDFTIGFHFGDTDA